MVKPLLDLEVGHSNLILVRMFLQTWIVQLRYHTVCLLCPATVCFLLLPFAFSVISGSDICAEHCKLERKGNRVVLYPLLGNCFVNHRRILKPKKLSQGKVYLQFWCLLCQDRAIPMHLKYEECSTTLLWCISNHLSPFCMVCLRGIYIQNFNFRLHYISCWLSSSSSIGNGWIGGSSQEPWVCCMVIFTFLYFIQDIFISIWGDIW